MWAAPSTRPRSSAIGTQLVFGMSGIIAIPLLAVACAFDVSQRQIPNTITIATLLTGIAVSWWAGGLSGAASSLGAAVLVGTVLLFPWRLRALGGGDLKLAVGCAAWVGLDRVGEFALAAAIAGGIVAVLCLAASSRKVQREIAVNLKLVAARVLPAVPISQGGGRVSVPYGAAVAAATLWMLYRS